MATQGKPRILVVDDDQDIRETLAEILSYGFPGADVATAASGERALEAGDADWSVVVTDYRMPGIDGVELARELRRRHPALPIILVTAYADRQVEDAAAREGARVLHKPFEVADLLDAVAASVA